MAMRGNQFYPSWTLEDNFTRQETSKLYSLKPIGVGSSMVESLSGYIARLAFEHRIKTGKLFTEVFVPYLNKDYLNRISKNGGNGFFESSQMINGMSEAAKQFSTMLSELTGQSYLQSLTLLRYSKAIPPRGLLRKHKAWCPRCFEEMKQSDSTIFEPLIWLLQPVTICDRHRVKLEQFCPECTKRNLIMERRSYPGFCSFCNTWLGNADLHESDNLSDESIAKSKMVERIVASQMTRKLEGIIQSLHKIVTAENSNITHVARKLNVPKTTFWGWYRGKNLPPLNEVLRICNKYSIDILNFYHGDINDYQSSVFFAKRSKKVDKRLTERPLLEIKKLVGDIVADPSTGHMHVQSMADTVGCNRKTLYNHFSALCKAQTTKHKAQLRLQKNQRLQKIKREVTTIYKVASSVGQIPGINRMERLLRRPAVFREHEIRAHYAEISKK